MGVYAWIRDNVKQAVLLGFNDAVEQIGPPAQGGQMNEQLLSVLKQPQTLSLDVDRTAAVSGAPSVMIARPKRKRLGRSLGQIQPTPPKAA